MKIYHLDGEEILHLAASIVTISLAFSLFREPVFSPSTFFAVMVTVGLGFVLHELAHKYVAIHYGANAYYRAFSWGLALALILAFATQGAFVFAASGAVFIHGAVTREQNGKISLAGPMMNFVLAIAFLLFASWAPGFRDVGLTGAYVNVFLGLFNLIPFGFFDGSKVYAWSKAVWILSVGCFLMLLLLF